MKLLSLLLFLLFSLHLHAEDRIIQKMADAVCSCMKEKEMEKSSPEKSVSVAECVTTRLYPHRKSVKKLIRKIIKEDNEGEDLNASEDFEEAFDTAFAEDCPGRRFSLWDLSLYIR